jgi:hypothetical protein
MDHAPFPAARKSANASRKGISLMSVTFCNGEFVVPLQQHARALLPFVSYPEQKSRSANWSFTPAPPLL